MMSETVRALVAPLLLFIAAGSVTAGPVTLTAAVRDSEMGRPVVAGQTNLPDGTSLLVSVTCPSISYIGQDAVTVASGRFQSVPFSKRGNALGASNCSSEVTMPEPSTQPPAVRAKIGERGEKLQGALVRRDSGGRLTVRFVTPFTVSVGKAAAKPVGLRPGDSCPCGSGTYCVGKRGGRYCFTRSGNKSYR